MELRRSPAAIAPHRQQYLLGKNVSLFAGGLHPPPPPSRDLVSNMRCSGTGGCWSFALRGEVNFESCRLRQQFQLARASVGRWLILSFAGPWLLLAYYSIFLPASPLTDVSRTGTTFLGRDASYLAAAGISRPDRAWGYTSERICQLTPTTGMGRTSRGRPTRTPADDCGPRTSRSRRLTQSSAAFFFQLPSSN